MPKQNLRWKGAFMKRINFDLPEVLLLNLEDFLGFRIYDNADLERAISILLQKCIYNVYSGGAK